MNQDFDDICEFDEGGVCKRHKTPHTGRFYKLSQDRTSIGYQYRLIWDKQQKKGCNCGKPKGKLN